MCFEKHDPRLPRKRKVLNHYEEGESPVELISNVEDTTANFFYEDSIWLSTDRFQQKDYIETLQAIEIQFLKALPEEDFGHELSANAFVFFAVTWINLKRLN